MFLPEIDTKGLKFEIKLDEALPEGINADASRINQILSNLLSNALKFTDSGNITIHVEQEPSDSDDFMIRFSILDSGVGMSEEAANQLLKPFKQADIYNTKT